MDATPGTDSRIMPCELASSGAEWVSPAVSVAKDLENNKGRGLVLTHPVEALDVLMVSQAFVMAPVEDLHATALRLLSEETVDERKRAQFWALSGGVGDCPEVEIGLYQDGPFAKPIKVDEDRIKSILQTNGRDMGPNAAADVGCDLASENSDAKASTEKGLVGVWLLPSLLNHSCAPNTGSIYLGNSTVCIFAAHDLESGTELTDSYADLFHPKIQRIKELCAQKGFTCSCARCQTEAKLPDVAVNGILDRQFSADLKLRKEGPAMVEKWAEEIKFVRSAMDTIVGNVLHGATGSQEEPFFRAAFLEAELVAARTLYTITGAEQNVIHFCPRGAVAGMRAGASIEAVAPWSAPHIEVLWIALQMWARAGKAEATAARATAQALAAAWCGRQGVGLGWPNDLGKRCLLAFKERCPAVGAVEALSAALEGMVPTAAGDDSTGACWRQAVRQIAKASPLTNPPSGQPPAATAAK